MSRHGVRIVFFVFLWIVPALAVESTPGIDFDSQVLPILTHAGCNAGACHGAAAGRGGFGLSLFGSDPGADYEAVVAFAEGRRINSKDVYKSLLLAKPLGMLDHGGDVVLQEDSKSVAILRRWIEQGAARGTKRQLIDLHVEPTEAVLDAPGQSVTLRATATFSDGQELDVTEQTVFRSDDTSSVEIIAEPWRARCDRPGRHVIMARFWNRMVPVSILLPYEGKADGPHQPPTSENFVDIEIDAQLEKLNLAACETVDDATFLRRLQLDLTGRLPTPAELIAYRSSGAVGKREHTIDSLLDSPGFSSFWSLRLAQWFKLRGAPEGPEAAQAYGQWILNSLQKRRPYDAMVRELLNATGDSHVIGAANFARSSADARQHAELVGSVFLGSRIQCANCHNHPFAQWTQDDYHGLAAVFARFDRGRMVALKQQGAVTNLRTGEAAIARIPGVRDFAESESPLESFTEWLLSKENPYFAKATVNRLWDTMMGRGLVAGVDDFRETNPPSHAKLLDRLAEDFIANGYDLRQTLRTIASSNAYARSSNASLRTNDHEAWYAFFVPKPLLPEVQLDAIEDVLASPKHGDDDRPARAIELLDPLQPSAELDALGRCSQGESCQASGVRQGLASKLYAINGELLNQRITNKNGRLQTYLREQKPPLEIMEDFYLRALARQPDDEQRGVWLGELNGLAREEQARWLEDLVWAILNSTDFLTNR